MQQVSWKTIQGKPQPQKKLSDLIHNQMSNHNDSPKNKVIFGIQVLFVPKLPLNE